MTAPLPALAAGPGNTPDTPERIRSAACDFEALMIGQLLRSAREAASGGWMGGGENEAGSSMLELAEENLARVMASQGGIGLANLIARGLQK